MPGSYRDHGPKVLLPWANPDVDPAGPRSRRFPRVRRRDVCEEPWVLADSPAPASYPKSSTTTQRTEGRRLSGPKWGWCRIAVVSPRSGAGSPSGWPGAAAHFPARPRGESLGRSR
jgi:hypothetical protein